MEAPDTPGVPVDEANLVPTGRTGVPAKGGKFPVSPDAVLAAGTAMLRLDLRHRYCIHCNVFKPDRTHHCSTCRECVLLMDHHCPFTGNSCVGFLNRKFFVLFLYYATLSCVLVAVLTPGTISLKLEKLEDNPTSFALVSVVLLMMGYIFCALHAIALAPFSAFHTYLVLKNCTTIENQEPSTALHGDVLRRMDRGWWHNWVATFGPRPWLWFVPVSYGRVGDGLSWGTRSGPEEIV